MAENIILVDEYDNEVGSEGKLEAHRTGKLHRAFSIFVFNSKGELLLQKRAKGKYHSGGLWSNTCCSHPRAGEDIETAAHRRLKEEMGFDCELKRAGSLIYRAALDNGYIEHEFDHIFVGSFDGVPVADTAEAEEWKWIEPEDLRLQIEENPAGFSYWLREILIKMPGMILPGKRATNR